MKTPFRVTLVMLLLILVCTLTMEAQHSAGRWSLGLSGGANMWFNDFTEQTIGPGGEISASYALDPYFSLGLMAGYEVLKSNGNPQYPTRNYNYLKLEGIPAAILGRVHLLPENRFSPYVYFGVGGMVYQRKIAGGKEIAGDKTRSTIIVPAGIGFEAYATKNVAFTFDVGIRAIDDWADWYKKNNIDNFSSVKGGIRIYFGSTDTDDDDRDGLMNGDERRYGTNRDLPDTDGDGLTDREEIMEFKSDPLKKDTDGDTLPDGDEVHKYKSNPTNKDSDGDGLADGDEVNKYKTDPSLLDTDTDGLNDKDELTIYKTSPLKADTDGDGLSDGEEFLTYKTDPLNKDTDNDGLTDGEEVKTHRTNPLNVDTDGGSVYDGAEVKRGSNPLVGKDDIQKETIVLERGKTVILEGVYFETGKANLTSGSEATLRKAFVALIENPDIRIEIVGHTDNVGKPEANEKLSLRRAQAVQEWLVNKGMEPSRISVSGKGMSEPIRPNTTPEGRAKNRRIEFRVK